jgi:hypothetical protein
MQPRLQCYRGFYPAVKQQERGVARPFPSSAEVKNEYIYFYSLSVPPMAFYVVTFIITLFLYIESGFVDLAEIVDFFKKSIFVFSFVYLTFQITKRGGGVSPLYILCYLATFVNF